MAELIDKQTAIDALMKRFKRVPTTAIIAKDVIENLPPVQPELSECKIEQCCNNCKWYRSMDDYCVSCSCNIDGREKRSCFEEK